MNPLPSRRIRRRRGSAASAEVARFSISHYNGRMLQVLALYLLGAMQQMEPIANHHYYETPSLTQARYEALAWNIAAAVSDEDEEPVLVDRVTTGLLLVSIWHKESHGLADVMLCERGGDGGRSWGSFQTQRRKATACGSYYGAARVALAMVRESFNLSGRRDPLQGLRLYAAGPAWRGSEAGECSRVRVGDAMMYAREHPFFSAID